MSVATCCSIPTPRDGGIDAGDAEACPLRGQDESEGAELIVGSGRDGTLEDWRPLSSGDNLWIVPGEQGLQHVVIAMRGRGFDPTLPLIEARLVRADDCEEVGYLRYRTRFVSDPDDPTRYAVQAVRVTLLDDRDRFEYCSVLDRDAVLLVRVSDNSGRWARREVRVHIAGIDPSVRPALREAWLTACERADGGHHSDASIDVARD